MSLVWQILRVVAVIALLGVAAAVATPPGRLPLALRGVYRILRKDRGQAPQPGDRALSATASPRRRLIAFVLVLLAAGLALV